MEHVNCYVGDGYRKLLRDLALAFIRRIPALIFGDNARQERLRKAKEMLAQGASLSEIEQSLGLDDLIYFPHLGLPQSRFYQRPKSLSKFQRRRRKASSRAEAMLEKNTRIDS